MGQKEHKFGGKTAKGEVNETEGGILPQTAGTWHIFGIAANKKVAKSVRKVLWTHVSKEWAKCSQPVLTPCHIYPWVKAYLC